MFCLLDEAYKQLLEYRADLENPPLLVVSDFETIIIHTNFNNAPKDTYEIQLADLSQKLDIIEALFFEPDLLKPSGSDMPVQTASSQLSIKLSPVEPVKIYSSYGLVYHGGGSCPPLEGHTSLQMFLENSSRRPARSIKVDLEIRLLDHTRPQCSRVIHVSSAGWYILDNDKHFWHFRFDGTSDEVCLGEDVLPLGVVKFRFVMNKESKDFEDMEDEDYTPLEATVLKNPISSKLGTNDQIYQERILRLYQKSPAEDVYKIKYRVRAENFIPSVTETEFFVFWSNRDIPHLSIRDNQEVSFDFNAYTDDSSVAELKAALLEKVPLGSNADSVLNFLAENDLPNAAGEKIGYGVNNELVVHNAIILILKVRRSNRTQMIEFLFDENENLKDIVVEFFLGTLVEH